MAQGLAGRQMIEITSVQNEKIKETVKLQQKKYRNEKGLFLIEGHKPIFEAFVEKAEICTVFTTQNTWKNLNLFKTKLSSSQMLLWKNLHN